MKHRLQELSTIYWWVQWSMILKDVSLPHNKTTTLMTYIFCFDSLIFSHRPHWSKLYTVWTDSWYKNLFSQSYTLHDLILTLQSELLEPKVVRCLKLSNPRIFKRLGIMNITCSFQIVYKVINKNREFHNKLE